MSRLLLPLLAALLLPCAAASDGDGGPPNRFSFQFEDEPLPGRPVGVVANVTLQGDYPWMEPVVPEWVRVEGDARWEEPHNGTHRWTFTPTRPGLWFAEFRLGEEAGWCCLRVGSIEGWQAALEDLEARDPQAEGPLRATVDGDEVTFTYTVRPVAAVDGSMEAGLRVSHHALDRDENRWSRSAPQRGPPLVVEGTARVPDGTRFWVDVDAGWNATYEGPTENRTWRLGFACGGYDLERRGDRLWVHMVRACDGHDLPNGTYLDALGEPADAAPGRGAPAPLAVLPPALAVVALRRRR